VGFDRAAPLMRSKRGPQTRLVADFDMSDQRSGLTNDLADELSRLLADTTLEDLSDEERAFIQALPPPEISTRVDGGESWLVLAWDGREIAYVWEGSEVEALEIRRRAAPDFAENLSTDYWVSGG